MCMKGYQFIVSISVIFCLLVPLISNGDAHLNVEYPIPVVEETVEQFKNSFPISINRYYWQGNGQCVSYARNRSGILVYGAAWSILSRLDTEIFGTSTQPQIGNILLTSEGPYNHVAVVEEVFDDYILVTEQNFRGLFVVSSRKISIDSEVILAYIYKK